MFVAIAMNDVPIDVLALELGSNRNAIYKNLFDARRKLRSSLAAAGYPVTDEERGHERRSRPRRASARAARRRRLRCRRPIMDQYVEIEMRGENPSERFPGTAIHLRVCPGCRADHDGVLEAARRFGDVEPE